MNDPVESVWTDVGDAELENPEWVVENILPVGLSLLVGPPKSYKSAVELALIMTATGVPNSVLPADLSVCPKAGRALALSMEAQAGVLRHTAKEGFGVDIPNDGRFLACNDPWRFRLDQPQDTKELLEWADQLEAQVLAIDPLRNCHSLDENDSGGMIQMLQPFQQWAVKNHKAVILVHHSRKLNDDKDGGKRLATANDIRGTSALLGMADAALSITAKSHGGLIHIDAVFKRGEAWQRTIQLGVWGATGVESISSETKMVFGLVATGLGPAAIAAAMKMTKTDLSKHLVELQRLGALTGDGKVTSNGSTLVESAVRKYAPST
jgi:AAA domain